MGTMASLEGRKCLDFGTAPSLSDEQRTAFMAQLNPSWSLKTIDGCERLSREWVVKDFMTGLDFFQRIAVIAEAQGHHPDLHLVAFKNVTVAMWTHTCNGLSENDFIVAYLIDRLAPPASE
eukprot:Amastigsp_a341017_161.p2 type:complete len:121 gc:universal Amastigsp_a341017_161:1-363(+)